MSLVAFQISKKGEVIIESKYRLLNARANHRKQVREMLAQAIVHKTLDMERRRQAEIRNRLDKIAKIEMVKRVRVSLYLIFISYSFVPCHNVCLCALR